MRQFVFGVYVLALMCAPAFAQVAPEPSQAATAPLPAQNKVNQRQPAKGQPSQGAPQSPKSSPTTTGTNVSDDFVIGAEDVLEIKVWREPDLTTRAVVRPDGKIGVTLLGDVQASGLTATQLKEDVTKKLARYVEDPEVSVVIVEVRSQVVHLLGAVGRVGAYTLGGPLTIVELLARAGGVAETSRGENISIVRQRGRGEIERIPFNYKAFLEGKNLHGNILLKNGDVIIVR